MKIRIMTSNIWGDYFGNEVTVREDKLFGIYKKYSPDVLGLQEFTPGWQRGSIIKNLENAGYTLLDDAPSGVHNFTPLFIKRDKFEILESGYEKLPHTDDRTKSIEWAVLRLRESDVKITVCNTHFEWRKGSYYVESRDFDAEQLAWRMNFLKDKNECCAAFGFGDMNTFASTAPFEIYEKRGITLLSRLAPDEPKVSSNREDPVRDENGIFRGKPADKPFTFSIDHIVGTKDGYKVNAYQVITDQDALDASDHSPVFADIVI